MRSYVDDMTRAIQAQQEGYEVLLDAVCCPISDLIRVRDPWTLKKQRAVAQRP